MRNNGEWLPQINVRDVISYTWYIAVLHLFLSDSPDDMAIVDIYLCLYLYLYYFFIHRFYLPA